MKPKIVNILGKEYAITYVTNPAEVDIYRRESLWGQIDFWTRTIRIYDLDRTESDVWETVVHEVLHGIAEALNLKALQGEAQHDDLSILAVALTDVLIRNKWINIGKKKQGRRG